MLSIGLATEVRIMCHQLLSNKTKVTLAVLISNMTASNSMYITNSFISRYVVHVTKCLEQYKSF